MNHSQGITQYRQVGVQSATESASPYRLIQMLMQGAMDKITIAKGHMERGNIQQKGTHIAWAIDIIEGLRISLDKDAGGDIADNLDALYDYMERRLVEANAKNDVTMLDEVAGLMGQIKSAWDEIPDEYQNVRSNADCERIASATA